MTAKLRCQPGDLALVLRGLYTGSVVTVIELADEELLDEIGVADNSRPCWVTDKPLDWGPHDEFRWALAPDTSLMPIRPEPDPYEIEHEEPAGRDYVPRFADVASVACGQVEVA
jgi:hypothetical protein